MVDHRMPWPRGRALGGTSVINYMLYVRGNKEDYNKWERMGNPGWGYKDVLKYFVKSEDALIAIKDEAYHGSGGTSILTIFFHPPLNSLTRRVPISSGHPLQNKNCSHMGDGQPRSRLQICRLQR